MIDERFVFFAVFLNVLGAASYVIPTLRGRTSPNRMTWAIWALAPLMAFAAQMQKGVGLPALMTLMIGLSPLSVLVASFVNRRAVWRLGRLDFVCGAFALLGLVLWYVTEEGNTAIAFGVAADALAAVPTISKAYRAPATEDYRIYVLAALAAGVTLLTIQLWTFAAAAFPVYILAFGVGTFVLLRVRTRALRLAR